MTFTTNTSNTTPSFQPLKISLRLAVTEFFQNVTLMMSYLNIPFRLAFFLSMLICILNWDWCICFLHSYTQYAHSLSFMTAIKKKLLI